MKKSNTIKFLLKSIYFLKVLFIKFRKYFCTFLIPVSLLINPLFLAFPEKVNAQNIKLTCDIKNHFKNSDDVIWSDSEDDWQLEIDQKRRTFIQKVSFFYEGKTHNLKFDYSIINQDKNKIIAISDQRTSLKGGPYITVLMLDLNSKNISGSNIISDYRGVAFANYNGKCFNF